MSQYPMLLRYIPPPATTQSCTTLTSSTPSYKSWQVQTVSDSIAINSFLQITASHLALAF